jgi:hypothetical protein
MRKKDTSIRTYTLPGAHKNDKLRHFTRDARIYAWICDEKPKPEGPSPQARWKPFQVRAHCGRDKDRKCDFFLRPLLTSSGFLLLAYPDDAGGHCFYLLPFTSERKNFQDGGKFFAINKVALAPMPEETVPRNLFRPFSVCWDDDGAKDAAQTEVAHDAAHAGSSSVPSPPQSKTSAANVARIPSPHPRCDSTESMPCAGHVERVEESVSGGGPVPAGGPDTCCGDSQSPAKRSGLQRKTEAAGLGKRPRVCSSAFCPHRQDGDAQELEEALQQYMEPPCTPLPEDALERDEDALQRDEDARRQQDEDIRFLKYLDVLDPFPGNPHQS